MQQYVVFPHVSNHSELSLILFSGDKNCCICPVCVKSFTRVANLDRHVRRLHPDYQKFVCEKCSMPFLSEHRDKNCCICPVCVKSFTRVANLDRHVRRLHPDYQKFVCEKCSMPFLSEHSETSIAASVQSVKNLLLELQIWIAMFGTLIQITKDLFVDTVYTEALAEFRVPNVPKHLLGSMICSLTSRTTIRTTNLKDSSVICVQKVILWKARAPKDRVACSICNKTFGYYSGMMRHYKHKHGNMEEIRCAVCGQRFMWKDHLTSHMKQTHSDFSNARFECKFCPQRFVYASKRDGHLFIFGANVTHSRRSKIRWQIPVAVHFSSKCDSLKEIDWKIPVSNRNSITLAICDPSVTREIGQSFKCPECTKSFGHRKSMLRHLKNKHRKVGRSQCPH
ncbi:Zinc finger protein 425 [Nymphon striatum]|nr:Zinc finger protein 425 [Nymphon striatum]KAG1658583.1 Zinc finger protein 425 [Nymphon striatum]